MMLAPLLWVMDAEGICFRVLFSMGAPVPATLVIVTLKAVALISDEPFTRLYPRTLTLSLVSIFYMNCSRVDKKGGGRVLPWILPEGDAL